MVAGASTSVMTISLRDERAAFMGQVVTAQIINKIVTCCRTSN